MKSIVKVMFLAIAIFIWITGVESCSKGNLANLNTVISLNDYPTLKSVDSSVEIVVSGGSIIVIRVDGSSFAALSGACTHDGCAVYYRDLTQVRELLCPCCTGIYKLDGTVTSGPAGITSLIRYNVSVVGDSLHISTINGAITATVTTTVPTNITDSTAASGGNVTDDGGASVTARGVCWSTSVNPVALLSTKTVDGTGKGTYNSSITGLARGTTYYIRAYATNSAGTAYGHQETFTTP